MISIEKLQLIYYRGQYNLIKYGEPGKPFMTQFFRGVNASTWKGQHKGGCTRHLTIFDKYNIIPKYCFDCYKVSIEPRTVVELFKLMVVFEKLKLPNDNTRKCMVEGRENIQGAYKGLIYCRGMKEGEETLRLIRKKVADDISRNVPIMLKRGCSEYALTYPEYAKIKKGDTIMEYKENWQEREELADKMLAGNLPPSVNDAHNNSPTYTIQDAGTMLSWLRYAATIGDKSYLKISDRELPPFPNLKRPPFQR